MSNGDNLLFQLFSYKFSSGISNSTAKETIKKNEEKNWGMGENSFKQCNWQGLNLQNIQTTHKNQQQQLKKKTNRKIGRRPK